MYYKNIDSDIKGRSLISEAYYNYSLGYFIMNAGFLLGHYDMDNNNYQDHYHQEHKQAAFLSLKYIKKGFSGEVSVRREEHSVFPTPVGPKNIKEPIG